MKKNIKYLLILLGIVIVIIAIIGMNQVINSKTSNKEKKYLSGKHVVEIDAENYGKITVELDADIAPITVTNFIDLVKDKFYDGLTFHRIIEGFMIQGGDPTGTGYSGNSQKIKGEFKANGVENTISHVRGVISMARSDDYNSASSQFFIVQEDSTYLDGNYAAFGKVIEGMEVVDEIAENTKVEENSNGTVLKENQPVISSIRVIENNESE